MAVKLPNVFAQIQASSHSIPRIGFKMHERSGTRMHYIEFDVPNGTVLPATIPFGIFADIHELQNTALSQFRCWISPGYFAEPSAPSFVTRADKLSKVNEFICSATRQRTIVAPSTEPQSGLISGTNYVWESGVNFVDAAHSELDTTFVSYPSGLNQVIDSVFDEKLGRFITRKRDLIPSTVAEAAVDFPSALIAGTSPEYNYITYSEIKCGWYVKTTEVLTTASRTVYGSVNDYWPPVARRIEVAPVLGEDEDGADYLLGIAIDIDLKDSYNGPCGLTVVTSWSPTAPTYATSTQLITDGFRYDGLTFGVDLPACLHPSVTFTEVINNHPKLATPQYRSKTYPATSPTDWPATKTIYQKPEFYKGGYFTEVWTIKKPGT